MKKKAYIHDQYCVACGCCLTTCKLGAIAIAKGVKAVVDSQKCVGCGMCVKKCPASIIEIREEENHA